VEEGALGRTAIEQVSKLVKRCGRFSGTRYVGLWPLAFEVKDVHGDAKISSEGGKTFGSTIGWCGSPAR
jgi:hypothetical protein